MTPSKTILFVSGFGTNLRAKDLAYEFERYGRLVRCDIPALRSATSSPYAFVEFRSEVAAEDAYFDMHGRSIDGRRISVQWAKNTPSSAWRFEAGGDRGGRDDRGPPRDGGRGGRDDGPRRGDEGYASAPSSRRSRSRSPDRRGGDRGASSSRGERRRSPSPVRSSRGGERERSKSPVRGGGGEERGERERSEKRESRPVEDAEDEGRKGREADRED